MEQRAAGGICGSFTVCIDSYRNGVPIGRFYSDCSDGEYPFESVTQCLTQMEHIMDGQIRPQAPRFDRNFSGGCARPEPRRQGRQGTFALRILFRQNRSWQGSVTWLEGRQEQAFRSVLELILLIDSALQGHKCF